MKHDHLKFFHLILALMLICSLSACKQDGKKADPVEIPTQEEAGSVTDMPDKTAGDEAAEEVAADDVTADTASADTASADTAAAETDKADDVTAGDTGSGDIAEPNGEIYILCTSDVHCGIDRGFGYAGLWQIREGLEAQGYTTILVDDGDSIQGENIGTVSRGEAIIDLMNALHVDVAIPGNHEFDYGMERFLELTEKADYPYISCNFIKDGETVFPPYVIKEAAGLKIGFVGVTTPMTLNSSTPAYFQDGDGNFIYGFCQDADGTGVYEAVQNAVDAARAEGADLIYCMGHVGNEHECKPWTYADIIANTEGIDVFLDGHSHDTDQVVMSNRNGDKVTRCAVGTKLNAIGYSHISADGVILETGIWSWPNDEAMPRLLGIQNDIGEMVQEAKTRLDAELEQVVARTDVELFIHDPVEKDASGNPIRMIRRAETNLGDFCADAYRDQSGADIAMVNGGGIRAKIERGEITYGDLISVHPYGNALCVIEVTGRQILDALEWSAHGLPDENGGFLQVSGITFEIDTSIDSPCLTDEYTMFAGIKGARRVKNVMVGGKPIRENGTYTLAGHNYMLLEHGDGYTMFDGAPLLQDRVKLDNQVLIDYITGTLGGTVGAEYEDPYGQGRIVIE